MADIEWIDAAPVTPGSPVAVPSLRSRVDRLTAPVRGPLLLALAYFIGAETAFYIGTMSDRVFALFWPPNVILFCALMIVPQRHWWRYVAAVLPAHVIAEIGVGMSTSQLLAAFATNGAVAVFNAYGVRRFMDGPPWFGNFSKALTYIVIAAGLGPALAAFGGACVPIVGGAPPSDYWVFWSHWYAANALPSLTLGPVFLIWIADGARWSTWLPSRRHVKPAILAAALILTCAFTAEISARAIASSFFPVLLFSPLPFVLWAAVQYGEKGASGAILVATVIMTWRTLHAEDLFPDEDPARTVLALQLFLTGLSIPVLLLGALIDELRNAARTTRELAASLFRAQDEERRRIARDLHDSTGQNLIAATLIAGRLEQELPLSAQPMLRQLEDMLQLSIREIRTVSYLLHPPLLDEAGLGLALRIYVDGFVERSEVAVKLDISPDIARLSPDTELVLFRLVQEALTNISRHSGSPTAQIRLVRRATVGGHDVVLTIEDAGKGMSDATGSRLSIGRKSGAHVVRGVGLASMRERLAQVGGRLEIESVVGRTILTATLRIRDNAGLRPLRRHTLSQKRPKSVATFQGRPRPYFRGIPDTSSQPEVRRSSLTAGTIAWRSRVWEAFMSLHLERTDPGFGDPSRYFPSAEMIWIPGGTFRMGSDRHYPEEAPAHRVSVDPFWIDLTPVTNAQFRAFIIATGYVTFAEIPPDPKDYPGALPHMLKAGSLIFDPPERPVDLRDWSQWWTFKFGAKWRRPYGTGSSIADLDDHPVVHIAYKDATAYARWAGKSLPTEAEWEFAARGGGDDTEFAWGDELTPGGRHMANIWQGEFPRQNLASDGFARTSPVTAFPPNGYGLYDMIGNVWEWTADWYAAKHEADAAKACCIPENPRGGPEAASYDDTQPQVRIPRKVIKGGSHLCAPNYCRRYRPAARHAQPVDTSTSHVGFRCVRRPGVKPS